jgi:hypothetical protein
LKGKFAIEGLSKSDMPIRSISAHTGGNGRRSMAYRLPGRSFQFSPSLSYHKIPFTKLNMNGDTYSSRG